MSANMTIRVYDNGTLLGTTTADGSAIGALSLEHLLPMAANIALLIL